MLESFQRVIGWCEMADVRQGTRLGVAIRNHSGVGIDGCPPLQGYGIRSCPVPVSACL